MVTRQDGGAGLCPAGASQTVLQWTTRKKGACGGNMGSPAL